MKFDINKVRKFSNEYNSASLKASLILIPLVLMLFFWGGNSKSRCSCLKEDLDNKLEFLKNPDAIMEMKIKKLAYPYTNNLVDYELIVTDPVILEEIRQMIRDRIRGQWNRSKSEWQAIFSLQLYSGDTLEIEITKIKNGKPGETRLHFLFDECRDDYPNYSLKLGNYIEQLIKK